MAQVINAQMRDAYMKASTRCVRRALASGPSANSSFVSASAARWTLLKPPWVMNAVISPLRDERKTLAEALNPCLGPNKLKGRRELVVVPNRSFCTAHQFENGIRPHSHLLSDNSFFVDHIGNGRCEHGIAARDLPLLLQHDRKSQSMLFDLVSARQRPVGHC